MMRLPIQEMNEGREYLSFESIIWRRQECRQIDLEFVLHLYTIPATTVLL